MCGYIHAEDKDLLPQAARGDWDGQEEVDQDQGELCCLFSSVGLESLANVFIFMAV